MYFRLGTRECCMVSDETDIINWFIQNPMIFLNSATYIHTCSHQWSRLAAVKSAINNAGKVILVDHINHCIVDAVQENDFNKMFVHITISILLWVCKSIIMLKFSLLSLLIYGVILVDHINHCIVDAVQENDFNKIDELSEAIRQFVKWY